LKYNAKEEHLIMQPLLKKEIFIRINARKKIYY
jgi:hypothetical protein